MRAAGDVIVGDMNSAIGVCTLWSNKEKIASHLDDKFFVCGNLYSADGINYIIRNIFAHPQIRYLVLCGFDLSGTGDKLAALFSDGVDSEHRIKGTNFRLDKNIPKEGIDLLARSVNLIDMRAASVEEVRKKAEELSQLPSKPFTTPREFPFAEQAVDVDEMGREALRLDPAGAFHITVESDIVATHYTTEGEKTKSIRGNDPKKILDEIIRERLVTQLSHAAYLGRELEKAHIALRTGKKYVQDEELE